MPLALDSLRRRHREWHHRAGLAGRPWLILGAAPVPTVDPERLPESIAFVHINNAGLTAHRLGLPAADLTYRAGRKPMTPLEGLSSRALLYVTAEPRPLARLKGRFGTPLEVATAEALSFADRDRIVNEVIGEDIRGVGVYGKPSSGVAAVAYALFCEVPYVVLAGVSVAADGWSYDATPSVRLQKEEDRFALAALAGRYPGRLATTEPGLAADTGLALLGEPANGARKRVTG